MKSFEGNGLEKDLGKVRQLSTLVKKKILESNPKYESKIDNLTQEELEDFDNLLALAEQIILKYQHKKEAHALLKEFSDMIRNWTGSLGEINDEIQELIILAQSSITEIETAQSDVSSCMSFDDSKKQTGFQPQKEGTINLTKSATPVYTQGYQQNSEPQCEQVV
jgi:hypothetical protein